MQISPNLYGRKLYFSFPLKEEPLLREVHIALLHYEKTVLVDCGVSYHYPDICALLKEAQLSVQDLDVVIATHSHADHTGGLARLKKENPRLEVWMHPAGKKRVEDPSEEFRIRPVPAFFEINGGSATVDRLLQDNETIDIGIPLTAIHTPGHSSDSLSLFLPTESFLFTGDALPYFDDMPIYESLPDLLSTLEKLRQLKATRYFSSFCGLWDDSWGNCIEKTQQHTALIQDTVETYVRAHPQAGIEEIGQHVLNTMHIRAPVIPIFQASIKEHLKAMEDNCCEI